MPVTVPNRPLSPRSSHRPADAVHNRLEPEDPDDPFCP
jgi:hypothetical protein